MTKRIFKMVLFGLAALAGFSAITMLLWNWLIPGIFGLTMINLWQAAGLLILARLLFGGIGGGGRRMMAHGRHHFGHDRNLIREKWMNMSPEDRKEFIKKRHFHHDFFEHGECGRNPFETDEKLKKEEE